MTTLRSCRPQPSADVAADQSPEERGREALRRYARTWLHGARSSAREFFPPEVSTRAEAIGAMEQCVAGLLAPLSALCAVDDEAAEALGVLLYKAMHVPPEGGAPDESSAPTPGGGGR